MDQVVETAHIHSLMPRAEAEKKAVALFRELALPHPTRSASATRTRSRAASCSA